MKLNPSHQTLELARITKIADTMWEYIADRGLTADVDKWLLEKKGCDAIGLQGNGKEGREDANEAGEDGGGCCGGGEEGSCCKEEKEEVGKEGVN